MSAAVDITAALSFYTQMFLCEIKLNCQQYAFYLFKQICMLMNLRKYNKISVSLLVVCYIYMLLIHVQH